MEQNTSLPPPPPLSSPQQQHTSPPPPPPPSQSETKSRRDANRKNIFGPKVGMNALIGAICFIITISLSNYLEMLHDAEEQALQDRIETLQPFQDDKDEELNALIAKLKSKLEQTHTENILLRDTVRYAGMGATFGANFFFALAIWIAASMRGVPLSDSSILGGLDRRIRGALGLNPQEPSKLQNPSAETPGLSTGQHLGFMVAVLLHKLVGPVVVALAVLNYTNRTRKPLLNSINHDDNDIDNDE